jgi:hypothetical protein
LTVTQPLNLLTLSGLSVQAWPTLHGGSFALCDFLAKDEGGKNEVATAVAAAARINFLIMFIVTPLAKAWPYSQLAGTPPLGDDFSIERGGKTNQEETNPAADAICECRLAVSQLSGLRPYIGIGCIYGNNGSQ